MKKVMYRRVYAEGGNMTSMIGPVAGVTGGILDGFTPTDHAPSMGLAGAKGALQGAAMGAQFGPWGAAIGGAAGLTAGLVSGAAAKKAERISNARVADQTRKDNIAFGNAAIAADPSLIQGNKNVDYYALGGDLMKLNQMNGIRQFKGKLSPLSSNNTIVRGPSHAQGGVQLPQMNAELEGGETTAGTRVFSRDLGFADLHKPIAKAIGRIEKKAISPERINAMNRLRDREEDLYQAQEMTKKLLNL
jgi:hypothetical protein